MKLINSVKTRTPILALILFVFAVGYTAATTNKVVVVPIAADSTDPTIIQDLNDRIATLESTQPLAAAIIAGGGTTQVLDGFGIETVTKTQTGLYEITLDKTISGYLTVVATPFYTASATKVLSYEINYNSNKIKIRVVRLSDVPLDSDFSIIVHGAAT